MGILKVYGYYNLKSLLKDEIMEKICVIGLGYIGLPTACIFAKQGYDVIGVEINKRIIDSIKNNTFDSPEVGLKELVQEVVKSDKLKINNKPEKADVFIICVETPLNEKAKISDLSYVKSAAIGIAPLIERDNIVILESTVPPKTTKNVLAPILEHSGLKAGKDFHLAYCPERLLPGDLLNEIADNDRIIGGISEKSAEIAKELYSSFVKGKIYLTDSITAELVKTMENTYRDVNIALANELALVAEKLGVSIWDAIELANKHPRVNIHLPGPGVGGHCIPKDPWFIFESFPEGVKIIKTAREINSSMPRYVVEKIKKYTKNIQNPKVALLGVSFKANVDDTRNSPSTEIIDLLKKEGFEVNAHDPLVKNYNFELYSIEDAVKNSDCTVICVNHDKFKDINPEKVSKLVKNKIVVDTKNFIDKKLWSKYGFKVIRMGDGSTEFGD
jgi:UDP-N-acetyl-D-mannosaminuronic acid dehydrogenase